MTAAHGKPIRILLVDDEPEIRATLVRVLARLPGSPMFVEAESGEDAIAHLRREAFDVVLSDHRMTGMTGTALLALVHAWHPGAIRILATAYQELDIPIEAVNDAHVHAYIQKPWAASEVLSRVTRLLNERDARIAQDRALASAFARATSRGPAAADPLA